MSEEMTDIEIKNKTNIIFDILGKDESENPTDVIKILTVCLSVIIAMRFDEEGQYIAIRAVNETIERVIELRNIKNLVESMDKKVKEQL